MVTTIVGKMTPAGSGRTGNVVDWVVLVMRTPIDTCKCKGVNLRRSPDIPPPIAANASGGGCGPEVDGSEGAPRSPCLSPRRQRGAIGRSEEHTSELQSLMRNSYAVFCLKKKTTHTE